LGRFRFLSRSQKTARFRFHWLSIGFQPHGALPWQSSTENGRSGCQKAVGLFQTVPVFSGAFAVAEKGY